MATDRASDIGEGGNIGDQQPVLYIIAGEESGDQLGAKLMDGVRERLGERVSFQGVGGVRMQARGLESLFSMEAISLNGFTAILPRLPDLIRRISSTADAVARARPAALVLIDVPGFNLRVGKAVRKRAPDIPIIEYVSPSVWAYFPGRARTMAGFIDLVMAILPFEPEVHRSLGGPRCVYVGHPLIEMVDRFRPAARQRPA